MSIETKEPLKNIFRNPMGRRYLRGLFFEETGEDKSSVLYTLKREDHLGYPSLYRLYMEVSDPTEYRFACLHLDGWSHWDELSRSDWFKPYVEEWRTELEVKLRSRALAEILLVSADKTNSSYYQANKYLLEANYKPAGALKRGRPTKDEVRSEIKRQAASLAEINEDAARVGLRTN